MRQRAIPFDQLTRRRRRQGGARLAALLAAGLLLVVGCGSSDGHGAAAATGNAADVLGPSAPAKGAPVRIGIITEGKGSVGDTSIQFDVADATAKWLNEHRSGIGGRPIETIHCSSQFDPGKGADCANQMIEDNAAAVVVGETSVAESIWEPLHKAKIPVMLYASGDAASLTDSASTFVLGDPLFGLVNLPIQVAKQSGAHKVTAIVIDVPAAIGTMTTVAPPVFKAAGIGLDIVRIPPGTADMTPQIQGLKGDPGVVEIIGNDAFCISALNGLRSFGFQGKIVSQPSCITEVTRKAVPHEMLDGLVLAASAPVGGDNPSTRLYDTVLTTYGHDIDANVPGGTSMFIALAGFQAATGGISGDNITPETIIAAIKKMPEKELPGAGGWQFRCNGKANPVMPAVCVRGGLSTTLDGKGQPTEYKVLGSSPIEN